MNKIQEIDFFLNNFILKTNFYTLLLMMVVKFVGSTNRKLIKMSRKETENTYS